MPAITVPDDSRAFQILLVTGQCSVDDCRAALAEAIVEPAFLRYRALLVDRQAAELPTVEFVDDMVSFATGREALAGARIAIVTSTDAAFGMSRMLQLKAEVGETNMSIQPFRSYELAVAWLTSAAGVTHGEPCR